MTGKNLKKEGLCRKDALDRRSRILKAAAQVFAEKGIERATLDDIAERAGMGKGTIYRRIGNKEELLMLLCRTAAQQVAETMKAAIKKRSDPILQLKEAVNALCDFYEEHLDFATLLISNLALHAKFLQDGAKKSFAPGADIFRLLENILAKAVQDKRIRAIDTHVTAKILLHLLEPHFYGYLRFRRNYAKSEVAQLMIDLFLNGLRLKK